jgi:hypothetical protein
MKTTSQFASHPSPLPWRALPAALVLGIAGTLTSRAADPALVGQWPGYPRGPADAVAFSDGHAYVATVEAGLQVIDVRDPANPVRVGGYDTAGYALGVAVAGDYAYMADGWGGLQVMDVSDPANPVRVGGYDTAGNAYGVAVAGNLVYVADGEWGLAILRLEDAGSPPQITQQPQNQTVVSGQPATLNVTATGTAPLGYQWYAGPSGDTSQPIGGARAAVYTTPALAAETSFWVRVSNPAGSVDSRTATVFSASLERSAVALDRFEQLGGSQYAQTVGWRFQVTAPILVTAVGVFDEARDGLNIPHAVGLWSTNGSLLATAILPDGVQAGLIGDFRYVAVPPLTLAPGTYHVGAYYPEGVSDRFPGSAAIRPAPEIEWTNPCYGHGASLGFPAKVQTSSGLDQANHFGPNFRFHSVDSPVITIHPAAQTVSLGSTASFAVTATGAPPLSYQWKKGELNLTDGGQVSGATTATLALVNVQPGDAGAYSVVVSNAAGVTASLEATLTVNLDTTPPRLVAAYGGSDFASVTVEFSEPVDPTSATTPDNYVIGGGVSVSGAALVNASTVQLTTSRHPDGHRRRRTGRLRGPGHPPAGDCPAAAIVDGCPGRHRHVYCGGVRPGAAELPMVCGPARRHEPACSRGQRVQSSHAAAGGHRQLLGAGEQHPGNRGQPAGDGPGHRAAGDHAASGGRRAAVQQPVQPDGDGHRGRATAVSMAPERPGHSRRQRPDLRDPGLSAGRRRHLHGGGVQRAGRD